MSDRQVIVSSSLGTRPNNRTKSVTFEFQPTAGDYAYASDYLRTPG